MGRPVFSCHRTAAALEGHAPWFLPPPDQRRRSCAWRASLCAGRCVRRTKGRPRRISSRPSARRRRQPTRLNRATESLFSPGSAPRSIVRRHRQTRRQLSPISGLCVFSGVGASCGLEGSPQTRYRRSRQNIVGSARACAARADRPIEDSRSIRQDPVVCPSSYRSHAAGARLSSREHAGPMRDRHPGRDDGVPFRPASEQIHRR